MKNSVLSLLSVCALSSLSAMAAESTQFEPIAQVSLHKSGHAILVKSSHAGWGAPSCKATTQVTLNSATPHNQAMFLSVLLAAKVNGHKVSFLGECQSNGTFDATDIVLK